MRSKRSMSNFDIAVLLNEINQFVTDGWISNIYQIKEVFLFKLNTRSGEKTLLVEPGRRVHLTQYEKVMPKTPTNFCAALRKHIRNAHIENLAQHDLDRIVIITISLHSEKFTLVVELFGEGNLILCDQENRIVQARHYRIMKDRSIKPKEQFAPPPLRGTDLMNLTEDEIASILSSSSGGLAETLASKLNMDPIYAEEMCALASIEKGLKSRQLTRGETTKVLEAIRLMVSKLAKGPYDHQIVFDQQGRPLSTAPFQLKVFEGLPIKKTETYNDALDEFFSTVEVAAGKDLSTSEYTKEIVEIEITINEQKKKILESEELEKKSRRLGDLVYSNLRLVEEILYTITTDRRKGIAWQEIKERVRKAREEGSGSLNSIDSLNEKEGTLTLELNSKRITLDIRLPATENASRFYETAKKAGSKRKGAEVALQNAQMKLKQQQRQEASVTEETLRKKRAKNWYERYRWFVSSDDLLIIGGRDAKTNEIIVKKRMEPNDIFVHADVHGAPVVIVKSEGKDVPETTLAEACQFSVSYSKLWKLGTVAGEAYWVKGEQVSLSPPSGEYLEKGSFMVRGERTYAKGIQLKISIGVIDEDGYAVVVAGPPSSVAKRANVKIELTPGEESRSKLAHDIKERLLRLVEPEARQRLQKIPLDEFLLLLPSGGSRITD